MTTAPVRFDVKSFIAQQAEESGMTAADAVLFADKCYDGMPYIPYQPYGGAESFDEIDSKQASDLYQSNVSMLNYGLQGIITNVMNNENLNAGQKSAAIKSAATDFEARIAQLDISKGPEEQGTKTIKVGFLERLKSQMHLGEKKTFSAADRKKLAASGAAMADGGYPIESATDVSNAVNDYNRTGQSADVKAHIVKRANALGVANPFTKTAKKEVDFGHGFKMFADNEGNLRWVSFSSNAFEDHSREVFSTKALEDAVAWHDQQADRGPLRIFHIDGADIGTCDFQAVQGRFLIESGTFNNTPMGQKAVQYFEEHPEEDWQISVGYWYKEGDDHDGIFDWVRWKERSVLPAGRADNPYTGFWTNLNKIGEKTMHQAAKETLIKLVGEENAADFITRADTATKELEASGVRFKEMKDDEFGDITDVEEITPAAGEGEKAVEPVLLTHEHGGVRHKHRVLPESEHGHTGLAENYKAMPAAMQAAIDKKKEDAKDGGKDDADENADGSKKTAKKEIDPGFTAMAEVISALVGDVAEIKEVLPAIKALQDGMKSLQTSDEERMASFLTTRATLPGGVRPSSLDTNLVDPKASGIKELVDDGSDAKPVNPATVYVEDLFGKSASPVRIQQG